MKPKMTVHTDGYKIWRLNGYRHRDDGPAAISPDGTKEWWINGKLHRVDGPAVIFSDGTKEWYINGEYQHNNHDVSGKLCVWEIKVV